MGFEYKYQLGAGDKVMAVELTTCCANMSDAWAKEDGFEGIRVYPDHGSNGPDYIVEVRAHGAKLGYCLWCGTEIIVTKIT
jgi:hypothetical protein